MRELGRHVEALAGTEGTVLLTGETGTGKGWVAQMLHSLSARAAAPFIEINCAGLSATFLESELFGHERGAFTDAKARKPGLLEVAQPGTVFLDEVGDLSPALQPKLLKVLETKRFRRLGGTREIAADVRIITATNRDLEGAVRAGTFREDLYYRLAVLPLRLPPLRERAREDLAELALGILSELRRQTGRGPSRLSPAALSRMEAYRWPGNIRELRNVLERVVLRAGQAEEVLVGHLPREIAPSARVSSGPAADHTLADVERAHIERILAHHNGNRSRTAKALGISRATLYEKMARYGLEHAGRPAGAKRP
jgi:transcriptional regulator with PAS, ATPase and Fis domain